MNFSAKYAFREMRRRPGWFLAYGFLYTLLLFAYSGYLLFLADDRRSLAAGSGIFFLLFLLMGTLLLDGLFRQKYRRCQAEYRILRELGMEQKQILRMQWMQILPVSLGASVTAPILSQFCVRWYHGRLAQVPGEPSAIQTGSVWLYICLLSGLLGLAAMLVSARIFLTEENRNPEENRYARRYTMELMRREPSMETYRKIREDRTKPVLRRLTLAMLFLHLLPAFALLIPMSLGFLSPPDIDHGYDLSITKIPVKGSPDAYYIPQSTLDALLAVDGVTLVEAADGTDAYTRRFGAPDEPVYVGIKLDLPEENRHAVCEEILSLPCLTDAYVIQNALENELAAEARYGAMQEYTLFLASVLLTASFCGTLLFLKNQLEERRGEFLTLARLGLLHEDCWYMICRTYCGKLAGTGLAASLVMAVLYVFLDLRGGNTFQMVLVFRLCGTALLYICIIVLLAAWALFRELKPVFTEAYPAYES